MLDAVGSWSGGVASGPYGYNAEMTGAMLFDGVAAMVTLPSFAFIAPAKGTGAPMGVSFWARTSSTSRAHGFMALGYGSANLVNVAPFGSAGTAEVTFGSLGVLTSSIVPPVTSWTHYAVSVDATANAALFVNGSLAASAVLSGFWPGKTAATSYIG